MKVESFKQHYFMYCCGYYSTCCFTMETSAL